MRTLFAPSRAMRHGEIVSRLDRISDQLHELIKTSRTRDAVAAAANEYYTNNDLLAILRVTKRTLARYRQKGLIPYYMIDGKVYYKVSEVSEYMKRKNTNHPKI